jgi:hypothetical protein
MISADAQPREAGTLMKSSTYLSHAVCCTTKMIADGEEVGEGIQICTRNIISYDETGPASEMMLLSPAETREAQDKRQTL